jgi:hypothetical protein
MESVTLEWVWRKIIELEKIGVHLHKKIDLNIALEALWESWRDSLSLLLRGDRHHSQRECDRPKNPPCEKSASGGKVI